MRHWWRELCQACESLEWSGDQSSSMPVPRLPRRGVLFPPAARGTRGNGLSHWEDSFYHEGSENPKNVTLVRAELAVGVC
jgi:hypothetical protein